MCQVRLHCTEVCPTVDSQLVAALTSLFTSLLPRSGYTVTATLVRTTVEAPAAPPQPVIAQGEPPERVPPKALSDPGWEGEANPDGSAIGGKPAGQGG